MCVISIIIPAYNEEKYIAGTLAAIEANPPLLPYEVIVVDNGSSDKTRELVRRAGVVLVDCPVGSVAAVRNKGVAQAAGSVLVFIDADVVVAADWGQRLQAVAERLAQQPMLVTGSRCLPVDNSHWLNRYWFAYLNEYEAAYINSGHLITSKALFEAIGGFNAELETAEDYDFCMRAVQAGAVLENNKALKVTHYGYPTTVLAFMRRERWHGSEDVQSWAAFAASKMAWLASLQLAGVLLLLLVLMAGVGELVVLYLMLAYGFCLALSLIKFPLKKPMAWLVTPWVFYFYLLGRSWAVVDRLLQLGKSRLA
ncbi:glycosyltransferase [Dasania sp. GY-MA-18]|uniref:Glycosyltransferase n=1 Tax=Dasania phycosphaerae TaxID=2950436 RepID=A0A9J6RRB3_9GAMM|nr:MULTISPECIES: glycosyltransferase [Dasania]MCR8924122.1 glycosyltransferase [Dasania sp. GY-MA-18]MCZ0866695.1 glycosyltransferase [Dasania phycosphaerae]MCZ0870280.1 glycosyltransferase [Dasania phycosphaerae]